MADDVISKEEFSNWVPASEAVRELRKTLFDAAAGEIVRRAAADFLVARIERGRVTKGGLQISLSPYQRIGDNTWKKLLQLGNVGKNGLWLTNSLDVILTTTDGEKTFQFFGIRFDPVGLDEIIPKRVVAPKPPTTEDLAAVTLSPVPQPAPAPPPAKHAGGAPPKDIWERVAPVAPQPAGRSAFTQADFDKWMPVQLAATLVGAEQGFQTSARTIAKRLATDQIKARAERLFIDGRPHPQTLSLIGQDVWQTLNAQQYVGENRFWITGDLEIEIYVSPHHSDLTEKFELYSVRVDPSAIYKILRKSVPQAAPKADPAPVPTPPEPTKHAGGAPSKDFWPELWIAIAAQLYNGDLKPEKLADLESAMSTWAIAHHKSVGEATIRRHANKLWVLIKGS